MSFCHHFCHSESSGSLVWVWSTVVRYNSHFASGHLWMFCVCVVLSSLFFFFCFFFLFLFFNFSDIFSEHFEQKIFSLPTRLSSCHFLRAPATSESSCWDLALGGGSSLTRPLAPGQDNPRTVSGLSQDNLRLVLSLSYALKRK